jgi:hypothetical protein
VYAQAWLGWFEQAPSRGRLDEFELGETEGLSPAMKDRVASAMRGELARIEAEAVAAERRLVQDIGAAATAMEAGLEVEGLDELRRRAAGTAHAAPLELAIAAGERMQMLARMRPDELDAEMAALAGQIEAIRAEDVSLEQAEQRAGEVEFLAGQLEAVGRARETNLAAVAEGLAVERAAELGLVDLAPVDFANPETMVESMAARGEAAGVAEAHFGLGAGNPLTRAELEGFTALMQAGPAETPAQVAALDAMRQAWGDERTRAVLERVAKDAPLMAAAGSLLMDQPHVGQEILRGRAVLAENAKLAPTRENADARAAVSEVYGDAFAGPASLAVAEDAARALYASRKFAEGDLSGELDADAWEQALRDVVGGVLEWENDAGMIFGDVTSRVFPPRPGMTDNDFADLMDQLRDEDLALSGALPVDQNGNPVGADVLKRTAKLTNFARGQYLVTIGGFAVLRSDNLGPYILDLGQVLAAQSR